MPHELNDRQREVRVETSLALLRHTIEGILNRILLSAMKIGVCLRSAIWLDLGSVPKQCPKQNLTPFGSLTPL